MKDISKSNEDFLNDLVRPYIEAARITGPHGAEFRFDKTRTSKLLAGKMDVPAKLRNGLERYAIEEAVLPNMEVFVDDCLEPREYAAIANEVIGLAAGDAQTVVYLAGAAENLPSLLTRALLVAIRNPNVSVSKGIIWSRGAGSLSWKVGDLFNHGFESRRKQASIIVIPVNTSFDAHVTRKYEGAETQVVSSKTLHGQWITRANKAGVDESSLVRRIQGDLDLRGATHNERGDYPIGTIAVVELGNAIYYLLALSSFDKDNRARCSKDDLGLALTSLADFYDRNGQGVDIYLPLIGTGLSRAGLTYGESLNAITRAFTRPGNFLAGKVTVVITQEAAVELGLRG